MLIAALLCPLALAACAPVEQGSWWRPNVTVDEFNKDDYECIKDNLGTAYQSTRLFPGTVITAPREAVNEELYDRCMMARGYRIVPRDFVPPAMALVDEVDQPTVVQSVPAPAARAWPAVRDRQADCPARIDQPPHGDPHHRQAARPGAPGG